MQSKATILKPNVRENKTTIQITKELKEALTKIGLKGETYNEIINRLISHDGGEEKDTEKLIKQNGSYAITSKQINIGENITITKYERVTISIKENVINFSYSETSMLLQQSDAPIILEMSYNKPFKIDDNLYQIDLSINKVIFDNVSYSPKEFFGVLQKDMIYCEEFVYYYLKAVMEILTLEFKKSNYFFKSYSDYLELARWRTFLLNSRLSPEILSNDIESVLSDLKSKRTNNKLIDDVNNSFFKKIQQFTRSRFMR